MPEWRHDERHAHSVLEVCRMLHGAHTGGGDAISESNVDLLCGWLRWRLINWQPTKRAEWKLYDDSVRMLVQATLALVGR